MLKHILKGDVKGFKPQINTDAHRYTASLFIKVNPASIVPTDTFEPRQIVYLEHENTRLYAEVIQIVTARQICWARPLMVATMDIYSPPGLSTDNTVYVYDLRQGADLLLPITLFSAALDIEVIPLLMHLDTPERQPQDKAGANKQLRLFVRQVWEAYPQVFNAS